MPTISFVTTCKGRLEHIKETLPLIAKQNPDQLIVVDYGCPQNVGDWVEANLPSVTVIRVNDDPGFLMARARNAGLAACITDFVFFIDADVKIKKGFVDWLKIHCDQSSFYRAGPVNGELDKTTWGSYIVPAKIVSKIGGYDEIFSEWGGEDDDLYHRLKFIGITQNFYPSKFVEPISHDESMRMAQHKEKSKDVNHIVNALYMEAKHQVMSFREFAVHPEKSVRQQLMSQVRVVVMNWKSSGWIDMPSIKFKVAGSGELFEPYVMEKTVSFELSIRKKTLQDQSSHKSWHYPVNLMEGIVAGSTIVRNYDQSIKNQSYGQSVGHWDSNILDFWQKHIDRYYEFFILARKVKQGHILDIGAEFYNKYIKEVLAHGQILTIVDVKEPSHPDIEIINDLDFYYKFDMTADDWRNVPSLSHTCDTVLSFGVLGYYDFTTEMCIHYLDNMVGFLKPDGLAVIKVDQHALISNRRFPPFPILHGLIVDRFIINELHILTDIDQEYYVYYCSLKTQHE